MNASILIAVCYIGILLLVWRYGFMKGVLGLVPAMSSVLVNISLQGLLGEPVTLFSVLANLIVLGLAIDYAIFLLEGMEHEGSTMAAIVLSAVTTVLSFGLLALSSTAVLHSFGLSLFVGVLVAMFLSPISASASKPKAGNNLKALLIPLFLIFTGCSAAGTSQLCSATHVFDLNNEGSEAYQVLVSRDGVEVSFQAQVEYTKDSTTFVGLTPLGNRGVLIRSDRSGIASSVHPVWSLPISSEYLFFLFQLAFWPASEAEEAVRICNAHFDFFVSENGTRRVREGKSTLFRSQEFLDSSGRQTTVVITPDTVLLLTKAKKSIFDSKT